MDLTIQPPRKPSNTSMAGLVGLARMTDKARAYNQTSLGEYLYGDASGLDRDVLSFIRMTAAEYAEAADSMDDEALGRLALDQSQRTAEEIEAFNREQLAREPQDERHRQLLRERVAKYAPGSTDIRTVLQSMELDDWGGFRETDLTQRPPRDTSDVSVAGIRGLAHLADKARAARAGLLGDYTYGTDCELDRRLLQFLGFGAKEFTGMAYRYPNDIELGDWIRTHADLSDEEISAFNTRS